MQKNMLKYILFILIVLFIGNGKFIEPPYADWAHTHVVWYNNTQNQQKIYQMTDNYLKNQIPVGGFNIDSGWATCYNDFIWNRTLFPNPQKLIDYLHQKNIKVMLWATSMINQNCSNFKQAKDKGFLLNHGKTINWWHGNGGFLDFFNPQAVKWWKTQMDKVLNMGIDAWKCDGTDPMIMLIRPWPYSAYTKRFIYPLEYSHLYYGTFYNYTKQKNPNALIMARPVDSFHQKVYLPYAPKYVMFSGWVGDQDSTSDGLRQALSNVMHSAWKGYLNFGFDIGGYRGNRHKLSKSVFLRWTQVGSVVPFMQNGGNGLHQPWAYDKQTVDIYRKFVLLHHDLKSFFLTAGTEAYSKKVSVIEPLAKKQHMVTLEYLQTYGYKLADTFLVFPIFEENNIADMMIPTGDWIYYFNHSYILDKRTRARAFALDEFPIFIKKGSIFSIERHYLKQDYMRSYKEEHNNLNEDEIVLVYLDQGQQNRTFYHKQYTDYLYVDHKRGELNLKLERFLKYQEKINEQKKICIRIIGAEQSLDLKIVKIEENSNILKVEDNYEVQFKYDKIMKGDLVFEIQLNKTYSLKNIAFKQIIISS